MPLGVGTAGSQAPSAAAEGAPSIPFIRATTRHFEPCFDVTATVTAASQALGPFDVPAHGFIRNLVILVTATGGALGTGVIHPDFPWAVIGQIELTDTNGFPIVFPLTGWQLYMANVHGAYRKNNDPSTYPQFASGVANLNPTFVIRVPVEITPWDAFGSLSNQNQSAPFRIRINLAASSGILTTVGTATLPAVRFRGYLEAYSPVSDRDMLGQSQEQAPPGHGATQFWSVNTANVAIGQQQLRHPRTGNLIRNLVYIARDAAGLRSDTVLPDSSTLTWDSRQVFVGVPEIVHRANMFAQDVERSADAGVLVYPFTDDQDGGIGYESRHMWLPTVQSTRLEIEGAFGAAGTLEILTNDVAVTALGR